MADETPVKAASVDVVSTPLPNNPSSSSISSDTTTVSTPVTSSGSDPLTPPAIPQPVNILLDEQPEINYDDKADDQPNIPDPEIGEEEEEERILPQVIFEGESLTALTKLLENRREEIGVEAFDKLLIENGSPENLLWKALRDNSSEATRAQDAIALIVNKNLFAERYADPETGRVVLGTMAPKRKAAAGKTVSGAEGMLEFQRRAGHQPIRRMPLYNSGFYIDVTGPSLAQLHVFFTAIGELAGTYGRRFGTYFYLYTDLVTKQAVVDLLDKLIVQSNLRNWSKPGAIIEAMSINDFKAVLMTIAGLMYPEGYEGFKHVCRTEGCGHEITTKADLAKFLRYNFAIMSKDSIRHMMEAKEATPELLAEYHKSLNFVKTITYEDWRIQLKVPTVADYLRYGAIYNAQLLSGIHADNNEEVMNSMGYRYYRTFTPWVDHLQIWNGDTMDVDTQDPEIISAMLDRIQTADNDDRHVMKEFEAFVNQSELTHVCYPAFKCPSCQIMPETKTGYFTLDPLHAFFIMSVHKLI